MEFNLPEDKTNLDMCIIADEVFYALWDFSQVLRRHRKNDQLTKEQSQFIRELEDNFYDILEDHSVDFNKIP